MIRARFTLRCLTAFAAGGAASALFNAWVFRPGPAGPRITSMLVFLAGQFACGTLAGAVLAWRTAAAVRSAVGFGIGFCIAWFVSMFVSISLQGGGAPEYLYGAVGFAVAYGLGGGLGSLVLC